MYQTDLNRSFIVLRHQTIQFHSNTPYTVVNVDGEKVSTILSNVLINASKYGPEHSRIMIESRVNNDLKMIEIDIKDNVMNRRLSCQNQFRITRSKVVTFFQAGINA